MVNALGLRSNGCLQRELSLFDLGRVRIRVSFVPLVLQAKVFRQRPRYLTRVAPQ